MSRKQRGGGGGGKVGNTDLIVALQLQGVDVITQVANILNDPDTSQRIRADLLKDLLNYRYAKQKAVQVELDTGSGVTFNLDLGRK